jgi:large repetitive protein
MLSRLSTLVLYVALFVVVSVAPAFAQLPQITPGLTYLNTLQNSDGTWGSSTSLVETTNATVTAVEALKSLSQTTGSTYTNSTAWLQSQSPVSVDYQAQRIHALGLTDTSINALIPQLDQLKHAWGGDEEYETDNLDTASALQALKSANYTDQTVIFGAINYLLSTQNTDGGWGFTQGDDSNVFVTAQVVSALAQFKGTYQMNTQLASAAAFLLSKQNVDGGISSNSSTVYESALAFIAFTDSGQGQTLPLQNAINYLTTTQSTDGSWNDDPYSTALALRALSNVMPDLSILPANIAVLPSTPTVNGSITVTATVSNIGLETAASVIVRLLDNGATGGNPNPSCNQVSNLLTTSMCYIHDSVFTNFEFAGNKAIRSTLPQKFQNFWRKTIRFRSLAHLSPKGFPTGFCCRNSGSNSFFKKIALKLRQCRHERGNQFTLWSAYIKLEACLGEQ